MNKGWKKALVMMLAGIITTAIICFALFEAIVYYAPMFLTS